MVVNIVFLEFGDDDRHLNLKDRFAHLVQLSLPQFELKASNIFINIDTPLAAIRCSEFWLN